MHSQITMYDDHLCMMNKTIHGLVDLNIHSYLQFSKETRTLNSHAQKFQTPFSSFSNPVLTSLVMCSWSLSSKWAEELWVEIAFISKNALKFSYIPRTSREWNKLPAEVVLSPSLPVSRRKLLWTAIQKSLVNNMCFFYYVLLFFLFFILAIFYWIKDEFYNVT